MELFKKYLVLNAAGGDSIDIDQEEVTSLASQIAAKAAELEAAKAAAESACDDAVGNFLDGDSNKATLDEILHNGTKDISAAMATIEEFAQKLKESSAEWTSAEQDIASALSAALAGNN